MSCSATGAPLSLNMLRGDALRNARLCGAPTLAMQRRWLRTDAALVHICRAGTEDGGVATAAALAVLRGRVYIGLENRTAAARCFKARHSAGLRFCAGAHACLSLCHRLRSRLTRCATRRSTRLPAATC